MFCRLWQFTRKIQSPSPTARLGSKRRAARLVRPEEGTGRGESGVCSECCSPSRAGGKEMVIVPRVSGPGASNRDRDSGWDRLDALE